MASLLDITELKALPRDANGALILCAGFPFVTQQQVNYVAGSTASNAFNAETRFVRLHTDTACRIEFGSAPTAIGTSMRMAAGQTEFFAVPAGIKVAALTTT